MSNTPFCSDPPIKRLSGSLGGLPVQVRSGQSTPYTFAAHQRFISASMRLKRSAALRHVQVMKNRVVYCARILDAFTIPSGPDCWKVEAISPEMAIFSVPVSKVRACGGHKCACAGQSKAAHASACASAVASPEGLTCL